MALGLYADYDNDGLSSTNYLEVYYRHTSLFDAQLYITFPVGFFNFPTLRGMRVRAHPP